MPALIQRDHPKFLVYNRVHSLLNALSCQLPDSSVGKESACNAGDPGSIAGSGRSTREGKCYPLHYSWTFLVVQLVKNPRACSSPGLDPLVGKIPWRREGLPTLVFWPGEFHGLYSPWGCKELDITERLSLHLSAWWVHVWMLASRGMQLHGWAAEVMLSGCACYVAVPSLFSSESPSGTSPGTFYTEDAQAHQATVRTMVRTSPNPYVPSVF